MNHARHLLQIPVTLAFAAAVAACSTSPHMPATPTQQAPTAATAAAASAYDFDMDIFHAETARHGMVASEHHLASEVGIKVLQDGGNAVDAAVAVAYALAVVLPNAGNIGGGGFMVVHDARSGKSSSIDFREMAPAGASRDMYLDQAGNVINGKSLHSHYAVGVPGTVAGMELALGKWGTRPLSELVAPSVHLAEQGFVVSETLAKILEQEKGHMGRWPATRAIFWRNGEPLKRGDLLVQSDLGQTLRQIGQHGSDVFYRGDIATKIAREMAPHAGGITSADMASYRAIEREPVRGSYRGVDIVTMPPPSSGGAHLIQILNTLEPFPLASWGPNSARTIHHVAEASKLAYADRSLYMGDPDHVKIPLRGLTSKEYGKSLARKIDARRARPASEIAPGQPQPYESDQTTHFSVVDREGNAVAVTYTLNTNFGSGIVAAGTGIVLNNEMDDFSVKPGAPNVYGLTGGDANAVAPGKRPLSSMTPTIVLKDGKPVLVTGSPGGARIISIVLQTIVNTVDFGMNPAEAAAAPRVHDQWLPDELRVEKGLSVDTMELLRQQGHNVVVKPTMGRSQSIQLRGGLLQGASDPRNPDGRAVGY